MAELTIREAREADLLPLLELYTFLHGNPMPEVGEKLKKLWDIILSDPDHHIVLGLVDGALVSSCVIVIIPNLTHGQRPYALIENVVTEVRHRNRGYATRLLDYARGIAAAENCYKIMLLTGSKSEDTLRFYEKAGFKLTGRTKELDYGKPIEAVEYLLWLK